MIHSVKNLLSKIDSNVVSNTNITLEKCLLDFQADLQNILDKHIGSDQFDSNAMHQYIFTNFTEIDNVDMFCKVNLIAAKATLDRLIIRISKFKGGLKYYNIRKFRDLIMILISDLKGIVERFEKKDDPNYEFVKKSYPSLIEADKINQMSNNFLFTYYLKDQSLNSLQHLGLSVLNLRQSIEIRTKRAVGVYKVVNVNNCRNDFGFKQLIEFIEQNKGLIEYDKFSFENLKLIYNWSSDYVHNAILPLIWQVEHALLEIKDFYSPGSNENEGIFKWSMYGRIKIHDYETLKLKLTSQFNKCHKFYFLNEPNALLI